MKNLSLVYSKNPQYDACPECKSVCSLHRSRGRTFIEKFMKRFTFIKPYRCKDCGWRGYRSTITITKNSFKTLFLYIFLALVAAAVVRIVITRFIK